MLGSSKNFRVCNLFKGLYLNQKNSHPVSIHNQAILTIVRPDKETSFTNLQKAKDSRKAIQVSCI